MNFSRPLENRCGLTVKNTTLNGASNELARSVGMRLYLSSLHPVEFDNSLLFHSLREVSCIWRLHRLDPLPLLRIKVEWKRNKKSGVLLNSIAL